MSEMRCPRCDCPEFSIQSYDHGTDQETGYRNAGVIGICAHCKLEADIEDFQSEELSHEHNTRKKA